MPSCFSCNSAQVAEEYDRCSSCQESHNELIKKLDSKPRQVTEKFQEKLYPIKEIKQGVEVTTYISKEDAINMGIKLPNE